MGWKDRMKSLSPGLRMPLQKKRSRTIRRSKGSANQGQGREAGDHYRKVRIWRLIPNYLKKRYWPSLVLIQWCERDRMRASAAAWRSKELNLNRHALQQLFSLLLDY